MKALFYLYGNQHIDRTLAKQETYELIIN